MLRHVEPEPEARTGYMAAENAQIEKGDTVAVWGCGLVAQFAIQSAWMFGAGRVIAIDRVPERLALAQRLGKAETTNFDNEHVYDRLQELAKGRGPDRCIDAVGCEAHSHGSVDAVLDSAKKTTDRAHVLREALYCCRKGGAVSIPGVYVGFPDKLPFGAAMNKGLTLKMGQTHMQKYMKPLLEKIQAGEIDPSQVITHRVPLSEAPAAYQAFRDNAARRTAKFAVAAIRQRGQSAQGVAGAPPPADGAAQRLKASFRRPAA